MIRIMSLALAAASSLLATPLLAQETIRVGWTIPAEESKYWMMRRPQEFTDLGKAFKIEWTQFQGTAPMVQAMVAGALDCSTQGVLSLAQGAAQAGLQAYIVAQHVGERPGSFSAYWAVREESPIKSVADVKGHSVGINVFGAGIYGPMALLLKRKASTRKRTSSWWKPDFPPPRMPSAPGASMSASSISRSPRGRRRRADCASFFPCPTSWRTSCTY